MNIKEKKIVIACPADTRSGYGARSRDICKALINAGCDIEIMSLPWGNTPMGALDNDPILKSKVITTSLKTQPDIFLQISIPNEFKPIGKYNIGITAGIETTGCRAEWLQGINRMDLVLVSSKHSKNVFESVKYEKRNKQNNQAVELVEARTPIQVLFEGIDEEVYPGHAHDFVLEELDSIPNDFCFLFCGHWLQGEIGHDRKDIGTLIHTFLQTFAGLPAKEQPALLLKTSGATYSVTDRNHIKSKIQQIHDLVENIGKTKLPPIYLLHGNMTDSEMNNLYHHEKVKAMVSFTKGEGFGRPLLEFTTTGKPVIASAWSGQVDFLNPDYAALLPGTLVKVHPSAVNDWIIPESQWFQVNYQVAANVMLNCFKQYDSFLEHSKPHQAHTFEKFTMEKMGDLLVEYLERYIEDKTPELTKAPDSPLPKLKLPKIKPKS